MMSWDAIVIGGGLAGATFAGTLARRGGKVLVLEKEREFRDRVRGENMLPWGVGTARRLGVLDDLLSAGGNPTRWMRVYSMGISGEPRDLPATTPGGESALNMYHPDLQETLLRRAGVAGATVRRGVTVVDLQSEPDRTPDVTYEENGQRHTETTRIAVAADGRFSQARSWAGFEKQRDPELLTMAGVLLADANVPDDTMHLEFGPGIASFFAPLGGRRVRAYFAYPGAVGRRSLSGPGKVGQFLELCQAAGAPASWFANAKASGPLAEFDAADLAAYGLR
jgi:2-polyprenyl-6-methoxyphenol hydroxylase-like FAD-dependent oxidoreductase